MHHSLHCAQRESSRCDRKRSGRARLPDRRSSALAGRRRIEFLGRLDGQVKLRGFRIKPGEIEDALRKFPEVDDAVVILDSQRNIPRLIGYVVSFGVAPEACDLRAHLKARLPEYMAPTAFAVLREWPLTSSGKIDRRASAPGMGATCRYSSKPAHRNGAEHSGPLEKR